MNLDYVTIHFATPAPAIRATIILHLIGLGWWLADVRRWVADVDASVTQSHISTPYMGKNPLPPFRCFRSAARHHAHRVRGARRGPGHRRHHHHPQHQHHEGQHDTDPGQAFSQVSSRDRPKSWIFPCRVEKLIKARWRHGTAHHTTPYHGTSQFAQLFRYTKARYRQSKIQWPKCCSSLSFSSNRK